MKQRPYIGPSEAQANAETLERRGRTYADPNTASIRINWHWEKRQPRSLRDAADMLRRAYADEVPTRLHERDLADDGTPKMTPAAEGFIFGHEAAGTEPAERDAAGNLIR